MSKKIVLFALAVCTALSLSGCGGSSKPLSIAITASSSTVDGSDSVTLTAAVTNDKNGAGVSWAVSSGGGTLSNQTTTSATYTAPAATSSQQTITITASSVATSTKTGTVTLTVPAAPAVTTTSANLTGAVGSAFSVKLAASGGIPPFTWALGSGTTLPTCLTLKSDGTLTTASGTAPTASCAGSYTNLTFKATDSGTPNALSVTSAPLTVTITAPSLSFSPSLPAGAVGTAYVGSVAATGVIGASTYTIASGALPADLSLNASTGAITGTPKASDVGTATFSVQVVDTYGDTATSGSLSIAIAAAPAITFTGSVPTTGTYNVAFTGSAAASGGAGALTYSISAGALPGDLSLNASTGAISGNPNKAADVGVFNFTVQAADAYGDSATQAYTLTISYAAMSITTSTLTTGYVNGLYPNETLAATGGTGVATNYQWQVSGGALPGGLTLSAAGQISGTIANTTTTGTYNFTAKVTDTVAGISGTANLSILVDAGVSITTSSLPTGYVGSVYTSTTLQASGGTGTGYQWIVTGGTNLPSGLTLSLAGVLGGTPANTGTTSVNFQVTDSLGNSATASLSITVDAGVSVTAPALVTAYPGTAYTSSAFTASGGSGTGFTFSWAAASGSTLPSGLSIGSTTGIVSGTPTNTGTTSVTSSVVVTATDSLGNKGSATVSITIEATLTVTSPTTLNAGTVGVSYSQGLAASGGSGTGYTWSTDTAGTTSLAGVGLTLATNGTVAGASPTQGTATFTATVKDSENHTANATFTVDINNQLKINQTTLPDGDAGSSYSQTLTASGGSGSGYTFTATNSNLSTFGLTLATSGAITGTPTQSGTVSFTANVKDSANSTATQALTININGTLTLPTANPSSLPGGYVGVAYTGDVAASGGSGTYCYSLVSGLPADGLSAPANNSICGYVAPTFPVSGTPTAAATVTFTLKVTDSAGYSVTRIYTIDVVTPTAPALPTPSSTVPGSATNGQTYNGSIMATGGVGPTYTWTINGTTLPTTGSTALGASGLSSEFSATGTSGSTLALAGNPTSTGTVTFTAQVKDNTSGLSSSIQSYSIAVNPSGGSISGQIFLSSNYCSSGSPGVTYTVTATPTSGSPTQVTSDSSGNYSFSNLAFGTYTITVAGVGAASTVSNPASSQVTLSSTNSSVTGENFNASVGFNVSGTVSYSGTQTGQTYLYLQNSCGGNNWNQGTSITEAKLTSGGAFTIHGVQPGNYTLYAWMDSTGITSGTGYPGPQGQENANDPTSSGASANVTNASVSGIGVTLNNPTYITPPNNPGMTVIPTNGGVLIFYNPPTVNDSNGNSEEAAQGYEVQWAVSNGSDADGATCSLGGGTGGAQFGTVAGSHTFYAIGANGATVWILNNTSMGAGTFTAGGKYCFQARAYNLLATTQHPSGWTTPTDSLGNPSATTLLTSNTFCSSSCTTVSGTATIPAGVSIASGAPLYVGIYQQSNSGNGPTAIYALPIASPVVGANTYSMVIPSGSNYFPFGILDENNDGQVDAGDVQNTNNNSSANGITISGSSQANVNTTLPGANSTVIVQTDYSTCGTSCSSYSLNLGVFEANKLPVSVTLYSGPNMLNPVDIGQCISCGNTQFDYSASLLGSTPNVGDTYNFTVTYSDGTVDQGSAGTINGKVVGWNGGSTLTGAGDAPTSLSPSGTSSTSTTPTFAWTDSASSTGSNFFYQFYLSQSTNCTSNCTIWQIPGNNSNSNGFSSSTTSLTWGTDPTGGGSTPSVGSLTTGDQYYWSIRVQDSNGNSATTSTSYTP